MSFYPTIGKEEKNKIKEDIIAATDDIFIKYGSKLHITDGGTDPFDVVKFDDLVDQLASQMVNMINEMPILGICGIEFLDGRKVDLRKIEMSEVMVTELGNLENYLRDKEVIE